MKKIPLKLFVCCSAIFLTILTISAQRKPQPAPKAKPIIFAVMNDGTSLEPIGVVDKGALTAAVGGDGDTKDLAAFAATYYKPKTAYKLIFGGASGGTVSIKSSNTKAECGKNLADVTTVSSKAKLKGLIMGLATDDSITKTSGVRRMPTATERAEIETLVRAELSKQNVAANALKNLHYYNLTAIDVDNDGNAEMVGSYWAETSAKERNQLFFIADKGKNGKYSIDYSDYQKLTPDQVMSGEMKDLDNGIGSELFLDSFEYTGDKTDEIFTTTQGFEGNSFSVYSRKDGKWTKVFDGSNYHCAY